MIPDIFFKITYEIVSSIDCSVAGTSLDRFLEGGFAEIVCFGACAWTRLPFVATAVLISSAFKGVVFVDLEVPGFATLNPGGMYFGSVDDGTPDFMDDACSILESLMVEAGTTDLD